MNILDLRDLISRYEELESDVINDDAAPDDEQEFSELAALLDELEGQGGDEQWRGEWYPITLIDVDDFVEFCEQEIYDCGYLKNDLPWFLIKHINWDGVADEMKADYSTVTFQGNSYYYR